MLGGGFWTQFFVTSIGGGAISAIVGFIAVYLFRRAVRQMFGEQQAATDAARHAASRAGEAADASRQAAEHAAAAGADAKAAGLNSEAANEAIVWLAGELAKSDAVTEQLRERIDRLLGTRARALAQASPPTAPGLLVPRDVGDEDDPTTVTGRHRLHTQRVEVQQPVDDDGWS